MNPFNETRLNYDGCSYKEKLARTVGPGLYMTNTPYNDTYKCFQDVPSDPSLRYQAYGPNTCSMKEAVDDSSELLGLNYKNTKCNANEYIPGSYNSTGCIIKSSDSDMSCFATQEDTRLSNPACTLRGTGINRWEWLCEDPQERAVERFDRIPVNYRMVAKDNHVPCIDVPMDHSSADFFVPSSKTGASIQNIPEHFGDWNNKYKPGYSIK